MIVLGIDPGPAVSGVAVYDAAARRVRRAWPAADLPEVRRVLADYRGRADLVAVERIQAHGVAGGSILRTAEVVGRIAEAAEARGYPVRLLYRREVLAALDLLGERGNRDALVRARLIELHGGTRAAAVGRKRAPGPLYGVSRHAWAALAVAVAAAMEG